MKQEGRAQIGIDFSKNKADVGIFGPEGEVIVHHRGYANSRSGYEQFRQDVLETMEAYQFTGMNISAESTAYYWMPFFLQIAEDKELNTYSVKSYLLNPCWVKWFKKGYPPDNKNDANDPHYIAERTRFQPPSYTWHADKKWLPLRFYTRQRFHLVKRLRQEKNYFQSHLFLISSAYSQLNPFSSVFGVTSMKILEQDRWDEMDIIREEDLALSLAEISKHTLTKPQENARVLKRVAAEQFRLDEPIRFAIQRMLSRSIQSIRFLQSQINEMDALIAEEASHYPEVRNLATIPGVGPVFSCGIAAEIGNLDYFFEGEKRGHPKNLRDVDAAVAKIAGLWWPQNASGNFEAESLHMAKCGNRYLRYYIVEAADKLRQFVPAYSQYYQQKYAEVKIYQHKRALVLTARKSIRLYVGLLHRNEPFCPKEV